MKVDDVCRGIAAGIIVAPMIPFDDGKVKIPTAQAALWIIAILFLPVTLILSTPFWATAYGAHKLAERL
jgi:hypothetical protein